MKNLHFLALLWLFPFLSNGQQIIDVNSNTDAESSYAPEKLVKEVLIASACSDISNFTSQVNGVPSATATKSYGYFKKPTGSSFPFDKGIILTTGIAKVAGSPTTIGVISSNTNNLPGDTDLENALGVSATADATYFKFYFTPQVNEISFRYIMASEEYDGMTECTYADSFAFLLREVGTPNYTNLAVLPDGTPVSVTNINNSTICRRNPQYFDEYDPNTTNYGGHTKVLTAKSGVTIGATYEIKLVVADQGDSAFDSAIFLEAGSFNIGGDLGPDQTIANGNPGCVGTPITLDAQLNNTGLTFTWYKDGVVIPGAYNSTLDVTTDGTYKFTASSGTGGCTATDEVVVEFAIPPIIDQNPEDILMCDTDDDLVVQFDFTANEALVLGSQTAANFIITYHSTQANAEHNQSPLPIPYSNTQQHQTIWLRIADTTQNCYKVISFDIEVQKRAVANTLSDYELCDDATDGDDTNGITTFDLTTKNQELLGTQPSTNFKITYYNTQAEADAGTAGTEINTTLQNTSNPQTVYARIENNNNTNCYDTTSLVLRVNPLPVVTSQVTLKQCDTDTDGFIQFNLNEANILISQNHTQEVFTFYETQTDAEADVSQIANVSAYINQVQTNDVVYARIETNKGCHRTAKVKLLVGATQLSNSFHLNYEVCDDKQVDNDDTNGVAAFDFSDATAQVLAQLPQGQNLTVTYYETQADALAELNPIPDVTNHRNTNAPGTQNIYVRVDSDDLNACLGLGHHITLKVRPLPQKQTISNYVLCSDTNTTSFDLTTMEAAVQGNQTENLHITYHLNEQDAINNIRIPNPQTYTNISNPQTIFVRVHYDPNNNQQLDQGECVRTDISFDVQVNLNPTIHAPAPIKECGTDFTAAFDVTQREAQITGGDSSIQLNYFSTMVDLNNNTPIVNPTQYAPNQQYKKVYVLAEGQNKCTKIVELDLEIILYDNFNNLPIAIEECEVDNDGFDAFDLTIRETQILNSLDPTKYEFTYYESKNDADQGNTNHIKTPTNFTNTTQFNQTIYVHVKPNDNHCFQVIPLEIIVNQVPEIDIKDRYLICFDAANQLVHPKGNTALAIPPIDTNLDAVKYTFQWYAGTESEVINDPKAVILQGEINPIYDPTKAGNYTVVVTNKTTLCRISASTVVIESFPPESIATTILHPAFTSPNEVQVDVKGRGDYEYALDEGPWQKNNILKNVHYGMHTIYVRDRYGCAIEKVKLNIIDYPKYFTPNGDGYHDTWNISSLRHQANAKIYIFDRYGKLLKEIRPAGEGWNGTFNGQPMPTTDYWFIVEYYTEASNIMKQFKAHFTLKR